MTTGNTQFFYKSDIEPKQKKILFLPPSDLYEPRILEPISLGDKNMLFELPLKHEYVGSYLVGIFIEKTPSFGTQIQSKASVNFDISIDGNTLLEEHYYNWEEIFWGEAERSGVILGSYKVPGQILLKQETTVTLTVTSSDHDFERKYGNLKFFIKRFLNQ